MPTSAIPPEGRPGRPRLAPVGGGSEPEPSRAITRRLIVGCLLVLLCSAGAGAVFVIGQIRTLQDALGQNPSLPIAAGLLAPSGYGQPETLLLVGNDQRKHTTTAPVLPHSNEMLLVRIDPGKPYISMMSIPRELEVTITPPGQATITTRLNYAYTAGGIPLLVSTIKRVVGVSVTHVVVIDFNQFKRAVDDLGCVYSTIDRRYFHVNTPTSEQYQEINLHPGYQRLCGTQALQFVSYRHGDTSLVRDARDQRFLLDVKQQYGPTLVDNIGKFERIFGQTVATDPGLKSTSGLLNLVGTLINSATLRVRQVHFQANLVPPVSTPCACVTASARQIAASVQSFLHGPVQRAGSGAAAVARAVAGKRAIKKLPLVATGPTAPARARAAGAGIPYTYEFPRVQDARGSATPFFLRDYLIRAPDHAAYPIYVAGFSAGQLGQYYDVQGTTWTHAPQLGNPDERARVGGRTFNLHFSGAHLNLVSWTEHGVAYWVHNSLNDALSNGELLAIAEQTQPVGSGHGHLLRAGLRLRAAALPSAPGARSDTGSAHMLGSLAALLTVLAIGPLALLLIRRRRELEQVRSQLQSSRQRESRLTATIAGRRIASPGARLPPSAD